MRQWWEWGSIQWALDDSITYGAKLLELINSLDTGEKED